MARSSPNMEVIHGAFGIVPSGVLLPLMQWGGRTHFLLAVVRRIPEMQELPSVFTTFVAWSVSEVIRYSHYALTCVGSSPKWITLIRYNAFIVLYPIGVFAGEMWIMYQALPIIKKENLYAEILPFSYYYFIVTFIQNESVDKKVDNANHLIKDTSLSEFVIPIQFSKRKLIN